MQFKIPWTYKDSKWGRRVAIQITVQRQRTFLYCAALQNCTSAVSHCYRKGDKYLQNVVKAILFVRHQVILQTFLASAASQSLLSLDAAFQETWINCKESNDKYWETAEVWKIWLMKTHQKHCGRRHRPANVYKLVIKKKRINSFSCHVWEEQRIASWNGGREIEISFNKAQNDWKWMPRENIQFQSLQLLNQNETKQNTTKQNKSLIWCNRTWFWGGNGQHDILMYLPHLWSVISVFIIIGEDSKSELTPLKSSGSLWFYINGP